MVPQSYASGTLEPYIYQAELVEDPEAFGFYLTDESGQLLTYGDLQGRDFRANPVAGRVGPRIKTTRPRKRRARSPVPAGAAGPSSGYYDPGRNTEII